MNVLLNAAATGSWLGGRYYLENLARAVATVDDRIRPQLLVNDDGFPNGLAQQIGDDAGRIDVVFPNWGRVRLPGAAEMHWIPDLQHRDIPGNFRLVGRVRRDLGYRRLSRRAELVVVSSEAVRAAVAAAYRGTAEKLRVLHFTTIVPAGLDEDDAAAMRERYGIPDTYALLANQFWAHKNHATAFEAVESLPLPLVCTGEARDERRPGFAEALVERARTAHGARARLHLLGVVPRDDYLRLVRDAAVVLQPSLYEGWSSIVEDAKAFGRPVSLSDIPVHREQAPENGFLFEPTDARALARAVESALEAGPLPAEVAAEAQARRVREYGARFVAIAREARAAV